MISKKTLPLVALLLLVAAAFAVGASQVIGFQQPAGSVVIPAGAPQDNGQAARTLPQAPALPAARGPIAFADSFDGDKLTAWRELTANTGTWAPVAGHLEQWGDVDRQPSEDAAVFVSNDSTFTDGTFEANALSTSGETLGVVFRGSDAGYYRLDLSPALPNSTAKAALYKVTANGAEQIASNTTWAGFALNEWQRIEVNTAGSRITVSANGTPLFTAQDSSFAGGWVGLWSVADRGANFDNVRVQRTGAGR